MAIVWSESCDSSAAVGWNERDFTITIQGTRYADGVGGTWINGGGTGNGLGLFKHLSAADEHATVTMGCAFRIRSDTTVDMNLMSFGDQGTGSGSRVFATVWLEHETVGAGANDAWSISVRLGTLISGTLLAQSSSWVVAESPPDGQYHPVECKYVVGAAGSVEVRVDEQTVAFATGIDTRNGFGATVINRVGIFVYRGSNSIIEMDDIWVTNGSGSAPYNGFLGDVRVLLLRPNGAGTVSDWTPGGTAPDAVNHYENVNNTGLAMDPYNASSTDEEAENYAMANTPATFAGDIYAVVQKTGMYETFSEVTAATTISDATSEIESSPKALPTTIEGPGSAPNEALGVHIDIHETKPSGGAWTKTDVDAMLCGVKVKSVS